MLVHDDILNRVKNYHNYINVYETEEAKPLIESFAYDRLQSVSYDVSMSNMVMKFPEKSKTINLGQEKDVEDLLEEINISESYKLKPGEYLLVRLNERINMPNDLAAHIRPRTTFNKLGLIISCQHINPSYSGHLQIGIKNETPNIFVLVPGLVIGQIVFETLNGVVRRGALYKNKKDSKYQNEDKFVSSKIYKEASVIRANKILNNIFDELR